MSGQRFSLRIGYRRVNFTGRERWATAINDSLPAPTLRWREGDRVHLTVVNQLAHDSSLHWHGIILPSAMDGVPGLSFAGIRPGEAFEYAFDVGQSGTYWYHSHSGFQEQTGLYGAIVIDPAEPDPATGDRDYVVVLSDWTDERPTRVYAKLKKMSHYYNFRERTVGDLAEDVGARGWRATFRRRAMWNEMRMSDSDIADVTGHTYTFLMNGAPPADGWLGAFSPGERVRLRFINAAAMTLFDVRVPGLKMTVVAADGQAVEPVSVDEFRIGVAETYDVLVEPDAERAYAVFAQSIDRTGYALGHLAPASNPDLRAAAPNMDPAPVLGHRDMGMAHGAGRPAPARPAPARAGLGSSAAIRHASSERGPQVDMRASAPKSGLDDPGVGLREHLRRHDRRVLRYADLRAAHPTRDRRDPSREIQLHLTGNMHRYMWSFDGIKFADAEPLRLAYGERLRIVLVNDTMMTHPVHLHGMWSELETGDPERIPRKHTVIVQPGSTISYLLSADAVGRWAYHCHLLYHMPGMMREVRVG